MITIACCNQKGGVGKTTTAVNLGGWFARHGRRVLLVDLDGQGHVAESLGGLERGDGLFRLLVQERKLGEVVCEGRPGLDVITNDHTVDAVKAYAQAHDFRAYLLNMALRQGDQRYDLAILDTPPSTDVLHIAALAASDYMIIPAVMDHLALTGVMAVINSARTLGRIPNIVPPALIGVLPTMFERRTNETMEQVQRMGQALKNVAIALPPIPRDVRVREASGYGKLIWEYAPSSPAAIGFPAEGNYRFINGMGRVGGYVHLAEIVGEILEAKWQ